MARKMGLVGWFFAWAMALTSTVAICSPIPVGSLVGSRNATLDGQQPLPHTTLLSGDNLQVNDGLAMVALDSGNRMILGRGSEASFVRDAQAVTVSLARGDMSLYHPQESSTLRVKVGDVTVAPAQGYKTLGEIAMVDGLLVITAKNGALQVEKAGATKEVNQGSTLTIATTAARSPVPVPPGNRHLKHVFNQKTLVILGVAGEAAAVTIAAIALTRSSKQVSPIAPAP